jgi:hypothetical protein
VCNAIVVTQSQGLRFKSQPRPGYLHNQRLRPTANSEQSINTTGAQVLAMAAHFLPAASVLGQQAELMPGRAHLELCLPEHPPAWPCQLESTGATTCDYNPPVASPRLHKAAKHSFDTPDDNDTAPSGRADGPLPQQQGPGGKLRPLLLPTGVGCSVELHSPVAHPANVFAADAEQVRPAQQKRQPGACHPTLALARCPQCMARRWPHELLLTAST